MKKIFLPVGTRPEAVKMAPLISALRELPDKFKVHVCSTGQHEEMLNQTLGAFGIQPDSRLNVMTENQNLAGLSARLFTGLDEMMERENPDLVLVQGDTTSVQIAALCAFYKHIPVGHVEAGLRTGNLDAPFPEEMNRRIVTLASAWHFAPTESARRNLLKEGIPDKNITVTGNTGIDALFLMRSLNRFSPPALPKEVEEILGKRKLVLVTGHRRENFGDGIKNICASLDQLARLRPDIAIVYPVHLNPNISKPVTRLLGNHSNIYLMHPQPYAQFVRLLESANIILTDSGGIQEESAALGISVLVMRDTTERPEGLDAGRSKLVGTNPDRIVQETLKELAGGKRADISRLYGDGNACRRIVEFLLARAR